MVKSYCVKQRKQTECVEPSGYKNNLVLVQNAEYKKLNLLRIRETNSALPWEGHFRYSSIHWSRFIFNKGFTLAW